MLNDAYSHDISKKTRCALTTKRQNGDYVGACTIYGYQKDEDNKNRLAIDETTARTVQDIFRMKINGISAKKIADELNRLGVLSPIEYKKSKGLPHPTGGFADKEGAKWSVTTIVKQLNDRNILPPSQYAAKIGKITNENLIGSGKWQTRTVAKLLATDLFTGDMVQGKMKTIDHTQYPVDEKGWIVVRSTHEPIVSREMFDAVKAYREQVADKCVQKEKIHFTDNLLKGKIFCDCCKKNIHRQRCHENYVFHCISNSRIAKGTCTGVTVREDELFEAIMCVIRKEADTLLDKNRGLQKKSPELDAKRKAAIEQIAAFKQDIDKNQGYLKGLYENLSRGIISLADYTSMKASYTAKIQAAMEKIAALEHRQKELDAQSKQFTSLANSVKHIPKAAPLTADLVERLIERIDLRSDKSFKITFRFENEFPRIDEVCGHA